jgi:uncharacterized protein YrzB (UPF0473 family)
MKTIIIIINERHNLLPKQKEILEQDYKNFEVLKVPAGGWNLQEQKEVASRLYKQVATNLLGEETGNTIVFVSPVPFLMKEMQKRAIMSVPFHDMSREYENYRVLVFHNDRREKKELPDGKVISVVAKEGWQLV